MSTTGSVILNVEVLLLQIGEKVKVLIASLDLETDARGAVAVHGKSIYLSHRCYAQDCCRHDSPFHEEATRGGIGQSSNAKIARNSSMPRLVLDIMSETAVDRFLPKLTN